MGARHVSKDSGQRAARQAEALEGLLSPDASALFYNVGLDRYSQTKRNNNRMPGRIAANRRLRAVDGEWAAIISSDGAASAWDLGFVFECVGRIPGDVGKIACMSPDDLASGIDAAAGKAAESGITLLFDDSGALSSRGFEPLVPAGLVGYSDESPWGRPRRRIVWRGAAPDDYVASMEAVMRDDAFHAVMSRLKDALSSFGVLVSGPDAMLREAVAALSYGRCDVSGLICARPERVFPKYFPCEFEEDPLVSKADIRAEYEGLAAGAMEMAGIWRRVMGDNRLRFDLHARDEGFSSELARAADFGRKFGIDELVKLHFDDGVPACDLSL